MQNGDPPLPERLSKISDPYLQKVIDREKYLDLTGSVKAPRPELPVDIQRSHDLWILQVLHIVHKSYLLGFLVIVGFSLPLCSLLPVAKENVLTKVGIALSSNVLLTTKLKDHTLVVSSLYLDTLAPPHNQF